MRWRPFFSVWSRRFSSNFTEPNLFFSQTLFLDNPIMESKTKQKLNNRTRKLPIISFWFCRKCLPTREKKIEIINTSASWALYWTFLFLNPSHKVLTPISYYSRLYIILGFIEDFINIQHYTLSYCINFSISENVTQSEIVRFSSGLTNKKRTLVSIDIVMAFFSVEGIMVM